MSRFSDIRAQIVKGSRAVRSVPIPMPWGEDMLVGVRPLIGREHGEVLGRAREYAVSQGLKEPKDGDELYRLGQMVYTLVLGCVDPACAAEDWPQDKPHAPFFENADEVLEYLDPDRIAMLYEHQQAWQDECAPRPDDMNQGDFFTNVVKAAGWKAGQPDPLLELRPILRASFTHILAAQWLSSLSTRSPTSSESAGSESRS